MPQHVKINGAWKQISSEYVKSNSTWKTVGQKWVNVSGVWKQVFQKTISAPSTFTSLSNSISYSGSEFLNANDNLYMANGSGGKVYRFDSNATNSWVQISGSNGPLSGYASYFVFANGTFYLGSTNGGYKSTDLVTWTSWTGIPSNMYRLIHTGSRFFCFHGSNQMSTSTDGVTWSLLTIPNQGPGGGNGWKRLAYGGGRVAIVSQDRFSSSADDGVTWSTVSTHSAADKSFFMYANGIFLCNTTSNTIYWTSTDGINWTQRTSPGSKYAIKTAYANGYWVSVIDGTYPSSTALAYYSTDAINWSSATLSNSGVLWYYIAATDYKFIVMPNSATITEIANV